METSLHNGLILSKPANPHFYYLASWSSQNISQILIKVCSWILVVDLDLVGAQTIHPGHKPGQSCLSWSANPYQKNMTLWLSEYSVNSQHMVKDLVK